jgi:hypothetical protein
MSQAAALRTLNARLAAQRAELATCTTAAMRLCVEQAMANTRRQMRAIGVAAVREGASSK